MTSPIAIAAAVAALIYPLSSLAGGLPIEASFSDGIPGGWSVVAAEGNELKAVGGQLQIDAQLNTHAHISSPVAEDLVTVEASLKPSEPAGVTWCTSLFIVWDGGNWRQIGVKDNGAEAAIYVAEMTGGVVREVPLEACKPGAWAHVRLELGSGHVRYYWSADGKDWKVVRTSLRPPALAAAPSGVAAGKGFGRGTAPYASPGLANDYADRGPRVTSYVDDLRVYSTPADRQKLSAEQMDRLVNAKLDPEGRAQLKLPGDPTFESVSGVYPAIKFPKETVGVPEHPIDISVDHLGRLTLLHDKPAVARVEIGEPPTPFAAEGDILTRRLLDGYKPVLTLSREQGGLHLEQTVFGANEGMSADKPLMAYVRLKMTSQDAAELPAQVWLVSDETGKRSSYPVNKTGENSAEACLRFEYPKPDTAETLTSEAFAQQMEAVSAYWEPAVRAGAIFDIPDQRLNEAYRAWIAYSLLLVDKLGGIYEPHDGAGFYEEIYGYSATLYSNALSLYGMHARSRKYLDSLLTLQDADGLFTRNYGLPDMGTLLFALSAADELDPNPDWLRRVAPNIVAAADWILRQRQNAPKEGLTKGLIKFRSYCDYSAPVYSYYSDAYSVIGLEQAAKALRRIGMNDKAAGYETEAAAYRKDILASMEASAVDFEGRKVLPMEPDTQRLLKDGGYGAGDYYGCVASMLLETGFLDARDKRALWMTDHLENQDGLLMGLCRFFEGGIDHAYTYGYLMTQLQRGEVERVLLGMYAMLAYGMTRDTYSGVECTNAVTGNNWWTLPHLYSGTQQLRLLRNMILREDGDSLVIGQAVPRAWLEPGKMLTATRAPTAFGPVSIRVSAASEKQIDVRIDPPSIRTPAQIRVTLRHPRSATIKAVRINGKGYSSFSADTITLLRPKGAMSMSVLY